MVTDNLRKIVHVGILTGLRKTRLLRLKWEDVDFKLDLIYVQDAKGGKSRELPMGPTLKRVLKSVPHHIASKYVFTSTSKGKPWSDLMNSFQTAVKKAGIEKHVTFHTLRHTFASHLAMAGVDLYTISKLLGHASIAMTQRYAHLSQDHEKMAVEKLELHLARTPDLESRAK